MSITSQCPCLSNKAYSACCQALHLGSSHAHSAEQLMCSRYSAFVLGNIEYIIATTFPENHQVDDKTILKDTINNTNWLGLKIIKHKSKGQNATVEFVAFYHDDNAIGQLHERSNFIQHDHHWFYVDGEILDPIKLSRNELCFCGSGNKFKKCHANLKS